MSSVVQLFTKRGARRDRPEVSLSVEGGTYATVRGGGAVSGASGAVDYSASPARFWRSLGIAHLEGWLLLEAAQVW